LDGYKLKTIWRVINTDDKTINFQIGGHPAFMCPLKKKGGNQQDYFLNFDTDKDLVYSLLSSNGLVESEGNVLKNDGGLVPIDEHMFDKDALIIEGSQASKVTLCRPDGMSYLSVMFDAPLFGLWSPAGKKAPFVCIEPWYGRADKEDFEGSIEDREYINMLKPEGIFEASYTIEIDE
jgi:galactose mutarotase-like enzyme